MLLTDNSPNSRSLSKESKKSSKNSSGGTNIREYKKELNGPPSFLNSKEFREQERKLSKDRISLVSRESQRDKSEFNAFPDGPNYQYSYYGNSADLGYYDNDTVDEYNSDNDLSFDSFKREQKVHEDKQAVAQARRAQSKPNSGIKDEGTKGFLGFSFLRGSSKDKNKNGTDSKRSSKGKSYETKIGLSDSENVYDSRPASRQRAEHDAKMLSRLSGSTRTGKKDAASPDKGAAKPRQYRFSIEDPDSFSKKVEQLPMSKTNTGSTKSASSTSELDDGIKISTKQRGSVQLMALQTNVGKSISGSTDRSFDDVGIELMQAPKDMPVNRSASKASAASQATITTSASQASAIEDEAPKCATFNGTIEDIENFPAVVADLAHEANILAVVMSSRIDNLRKKHKEKPDSFKPGSFGVRILCQLGDAVNVGSYVLLKVNYMLRHLISQNLTDVHHRPTKPMPIKDYPAEDQASEAMRSMHSGCSKIAHTAEELAQLCPVVKKEQKSFKGRNDPAMFTQKFKEFHENNYIKVKRRGSVSSKNSPSDDDVGVISKDEFLVALDQFYALKAHYQAIVAKSSTIQRIIDTNLAAPSLGGAIKVLVAASRFKKFGKKK